MAKQKVYTEDENKLISTTEYVLNHPATSDYEYVVGNMLGYASFMQETVERGKLEPCVDGKPLKDIETIYDGTDEMIREYMEAEKKVVFKGIKIIEDDGEGWRLEIKDNDGVTYLWIVNNLIMEDLLEKQSAFTKFILTDKKCKELKL